MTRVASREIHRDSDYLASDTHDGADSATTLLCYDIDFFVSGIVPDLYIENETGNF